MRRSRPHYSPRVSPRPRRQRQRQRQRVRRSRPPRRWPRLRTSTLTAQRRPWGTGATEPSTKFTVANVGNGSAEHLVVRVNAGPGGTFIGSDENWTGTGEPCGNETYVCTYGPLGPGETTAPLVTTWTSMWSRHARRASRAVGRRCRSAKCLGPRRRRWTARSRGPRSVRVRSDVGLVDQTPVPASRRSSGVHRPSFAVAKRLARVVRPQVGREPPRGLRIICRGGCSTALGSTPRRACRRRWSTGCEARLLARVGGPHEPAPETVRGAAHPRR